MLIVRYKKVAEFQTVLFLMCVFFCLVLLNTYSEAGETHAYTKYVDMANKYKKQKKYFEAEKVLSFAISKYPYAPQLYFVRGKIRQGSLGDYNGAILDYSKVVKLKKNIYQPKSYLQRGSCYYQFGLYQQAINDFTNCLRINPKYGGRVYFLRAKAYAKANMNTKAMNDLKNVVKYSPGYTQSAQELKYKIMSGNKDF